ncbi:antibiotic biosynthesis monooxygenase [Flavobacterium zepuense]|uniref:Antibiotic biosynthesis monooxygenase n=1 Tax=Flavobacterium zepuense TaxID=2593302 RepID=A0A552UW09_9FLAO|nr:antibiotic biosynthesis monooxygenase [Flavobacterium zepuense]TRW22406.1 antibiotic biosynthesis monooxygenase [Flavobacterium zepuense]
MKTQKPVHVAIVRKVLPGKEEEFKTALRNFLGESFIQGGVQGAGMITALPGAQPNEIGILRTFASEAERDAFYSSQLFKDWDAYANTVTEPGIYRNLTGLEAWFRSPGQPPRYKMAIATLIGVVPTGVFLSYVIGPFIANANVLVQQLVFGACVVSLLTWVVMPLVTKLLKGWLNK